METTTSSDGDGRASSYLGIIWFLVVAPLVFLGLRIFTKFFRRCGLWWDDHILIASWVCLLIQACIMTSSVSLGFGKHMAQVDPANYTALLLEGSLSTMFSVLAATWSKTSFAFTLLRLCKTRPWMKLVLWLIIVSMNVLMYLTIILKFVQCNPVAKNWDESLPGTCWPQRIFIGFAMLSGLYSGAMDFALALLPWVLLKDLQMHRREKLGVAVAMSMGVFAGATAIVKTVKIMSYKHDDYTYITVELSIWGTAETATTIMAASIPVLRMLVRAVKSSYDGGKYQANKDWQDLEIRIPSGIYAAGPSEARPKLARTEKAKKIQQPPRIDSGPAGGPEFGGFHGNEKTFLQLDSDSETRPY